MSGLFYGRSGGLPNKPIPASVGRPRGAPDAEAARVSILKRMAAEHNLIALSTSIFPFDPWQSDIFVDEAFLPPVDREIERKRTDPSKTQRIQVLELSAEKRQELPVQLNRLTSEIFKGPSLRSLGELTNDKSATQIAIEIYKNPEGQPVGYHVLKVNKLEVEGHGTLHVMRNRIAILPEYRRGNNVFRFALQEAARYKLKHPSSDLRYFTLIIHPTSYSVLGKVVPHLLQPNPLHPMDDKTRATIAAIASSKGLEIADPNNPLLMKTPTVTRQSEEDAQRFRDSNNPFIKYFIDQTNMEPGRGLAVMVPCNAGDIASLVTRQALSSVWPWQGRVKSP